MSRPAFEVADILNQATERSFVRLLCCALWLRFLTDMTQVLMDEVGRGTTPEDGVAIGYACLHHLHYKIRCRTLFATHFHEMTALAKSLACSYS